MSVHRLQTLVPPLPCIQPLHAHGCLALKFARQLRRRCPSKYATALQVPHLEALVAAFQEQEQADAAQAAAEQVSYALGTSTCKIPDPSFCDHSAGGAQHDLHAEPVCQGDQSLLPDTTWRSCLCGNEGTQQLLQAVTPICLASGRQHGALLQKTCMCESCRLLRRPGRSRRFCCSSWTIRLLTWTGSWRSKGPPSPLVRQQTSGLWPQTECNTSAGYIANSHLARQSLCYLRGRMSSDGHSAVLVPAQA